MGVHRYIYALRGWLAFVAFMDLGTAFRCFLDDDFLAVKVYNAGTVYPVHPAMARLFGMWSILNATVILHCALCIHHFPIYVMTIFSLLLGSLTYVLEVFYYKTAALGLSVIFPVSVKGVTVVLLCIAPHYLWSPEILKEDQDEEEEIFKKVGGCTKNRSKKKEGMKKIS